MNPSTLIQRAVNNHLWDGRWPLTIGHASHEMGAIYFAAEQASVDGSVPHPAFVDFAMRRIADAIERALGDHYTLEDWLFANVAESITAPHEQLQAYRKRWLLHIAEQFRTENQ